MRQRRQSGAKLSIVAASIALFGAFFAIVRAQPLTAAQPEPTPDAPAPDYGRFFAPNAATAPSSVATPSALAPAAAPHTRTRAS